MVLPKGDLVIAILHVKDGPNFVPSLTLEDVGNSGEGVRVNYGFLIKSSKIYH